MQKPATETCVDRIMQDEKGKRIFKKSELKEKIAEKEEDKTDKDDQQVEQNYDLPLFDLYLEVGGSEQLIKLALKTLDTYKNKKTKEMISNMLKDF